MSSHTGRLVLTTADPRVAPEREPVLRVLRQAGFIAEPLIDDPDAFEVGPHLLELLSFTGCAVVLPRASPGGLGCEVRIRGPAPTPRLMWGRNTRGPRCPGCRTRLQGWRERIPIWEARPFLVQPCPSCGGMDPPWRWDWKQGGGFGRLFVLVEEVFPGEAVPTQGLLERLSGAGGSGWRHFYVQD